MLRPGSTIAVIAPAGIPDIARVEAGMALLRDWGYRTLEGRHLRARDRYNAGTAQQRTEDLSWALSSPQVDAVWLARGGYGCVHCLAGLPDTFPKDRVVIGHSDATSLFCALRLKGYSRLVHGPMVEELVSKIDGPSLQSLRALLLGATRFPLTGKPVAGTPEHEVSAPLLGGNLSVLGSIAGTAWANRAEGAIVMLEDITEHGYRMDRTIAQLSASGFFAGVKAIALGEFVRCLLPPGSDFTIDELLTDLLRPLGVPIVTGIGVGHGPRNLSWVVGEKVTLREGAIHFSSGR